MVRDASGRIPIVVIPKRTSRVNPWLVLAGIAAIVAGAIATASVRYRAVGRHCDSRRAPYLIFLGVFQAFRVMVPEGANALLLAGGKYYKTLDSGLHWVLPYYPVSHLITRRVIPFDVPAYVSPTRRQRARHSRHARHVSHRGPLQVRIQDLGRRLRPRLSRGLPGCPAPTRALHPLARRAQSEPGKHGQPARGYRRRRQTTTASRSTG